METNCDILLQIAVFLTSNEKSIVFIPDFA
jgi:hypothetical protein